METRVLALRKELKELDVKKAELLEDLEKE